VLKPVKLSSWEYPHERNANTAVHFTYTAVENYHYSNNYETICSIVMQRTDEELCTRLQNISDWTYLQEHIDTAMQWVYGWLSLVIGNK